MIKKKSKQKGYTLLELLIITGIVSLAAASVYGIAKVASDWSKSSRETEKLQVLFRQINDSTNMMGYSGITKDNLSNISSGIESALDLRNVVSPSADKLNFEYRNLGARVCRDLTLKMLSSSNTVHAIVNGVTFDSPNNVGALVGACDNSDNDVTVVLNKYQDTTVMASASPSNNVNPTPTPFPTNKPYVSPPGIGNPYVTSTAVPVRYGLTDKPPALTPSVPSNPPLVSQPPPISPSGPSVPPFTPPPVVRPPATPGGGNNDSGGTPGTDSWACPIGTCSVILYVENDGSSTYFGLTMFPSTPSVSAKQWQKADLGNSVSDKEVIVSPTTITPTTTIGIAGGWKHSFDYTALRNSIVQYGPNDTSRLGLERFMGTEIVAPNGARFQIGSLERTMSPASVYGSGYSGTINVYFMKKL